MSGAWIAVALLLGLAQQPPVERAAEGPLLIGLGARAVREASAADQALYRGATLAVEAWNVRGGCLGRRVELVPAGGSASLDEARAAAAEFLARGVAGVVGPLDAECAATIVQACRRAGPPVLVTGVAPELEAEALAQGFAGRLCCARIGLLGDGSAAAKALRKALAARLAPSRRFVVDERLDAPAAKLAQAVSDGDPQVLVLDAEPSAVTAALAGALAEMRVPLVLSLRASGAARAALARELCFVQGLSPAAAPPSGKFLATYRERHGEPGCGSAEGLERTELLLRALAAAGSTEPAAVRAALAKQRLDGPRGAVTCSAAGEVPARPALWLWSAGAATPYVPSTLAPDAEGAPRATPDLKLGPPFGALRTDAFRLEPGTQGVLLSLGAARERTLDADLASVGLSTSGAAPLVDHLVKEELLARSLSIVSGAYGRDPLGRSIAGQSFKVSFALQPAADAPRTWDVRLAGDDASAAGRSWPGAGRSEVYTTNLLKLLVGHELRPPLAGGDRELLDGSYRFGTDAEKDRRSELVRALIQSYAGSLGLTTAHEVGHLFGLEHTAGDPLCIMFAGEEEGGIDPDDAHFSDEPLARLRKTPGVVK
ncbi:MAG: hypothetical protein EXS08_07365 [Planctomycetes bacterium]|nr:hypothetical protein [Planctomycetota bacterium]